MSLASACRQRVKGIRTSVRKGGGGDKPLPLGRAVGLHQDRRVVLGVAAGCSRREGGLFRQPGLSPGWQYATSEGTDSIQEGGERRHGPAAAGERGEGEWRAGWSARLHSQEPAEVLAELAASAQGLTDDQAAERLERHGHNRLPASPRSGPLRRFLLQFHNVLIYVLLAAALGTALLQHWVDTGVILGVVLINAVVGFVQEGKAEQALKAIRGMLSPRALVLRDGRRRTMPAEQLVPGDLVFLQAGDRVPADLRLLRTHNLRLDEAMLTGESVAVDKRVDAVAADADLGDRCCMAFSGTLVAFGQGSGVVLGTEVGR